MPRFKRLKSCSRCLRGMAVIERDGQYFQTYCDCEAGQQRRQSAARRAHGAVTTSYREHPSPMSHDPRAKAAGE